MPRVISLVALAAGLVLAVPSAAQVGTGRLAFTNPEGLYTADADGAALKLLRAGEFSALGGWSPDGSRIAFTVYDRATNERVLIVTNADGSEEHLVARGGIAVGRDPWSPDGTKVAWGPSSGSRGEIFTANVSGGAARQLTSDDLVKDPPEWSPDGSTLVYSARVTDFPFQTELFTVAADGSRAPRQLTPNGSGPEFDFDPAWSPTGQAVAFSRQAQPDLPGIFVINRDGSNLRRVETDNFLPSAPAWSPDGTRIAFSSSGSTKYGVGGRQILSVDSAGPGSVTFLTNLARFGRIDDVPTWSPDGSRIIFSRDLSSLWTMNSDGTCEEPLPLRLPNAVAAWQPARGGPPLAERRCHALASDVRVSGELVSRDALISAWIGNDGTDPVTDVRFEATVSPDVSVVYVHTQGAVCAVTARHVVCARTDLPRGASVTLYIKVDARRVGLDRRGRDVPLDFKFHVGATEPLLPTPALDGELRFRARGCTVKTRGRGRIDGTPFADRICGRMGADSIHPDGGKDIVATGRGPDVVYARDGFSDRIRCGLGRDLVLADRKDRVARDCEQVLRG